MEQSNKQYQRTVKKVSPNSSLGRNMLGAFLVGGAICSIGQCFSDLYIYLGMARDKASTLSSVTLIFIAILLTGLKLFDNIAKVGGAGALVPITGFANAMSAPAMEFKKEGLVLGTGVKFFSITGPVIVYGVSASVVYGVILWIIQMF